MPTKASGKKRSKSDRHARANAVYDEIRVLAEKEVAPGPLTAADIKERMIPPSNIQYLYTMRLWETFMQNQLQKPLSEHPFEDGPATVYTIKLHLQWLAKSRTGMLEDNITDTTLNNRLSALKRAIKVHTNYMYSKRDNDDLELFIRKDLVLEGLVSTAARPKPVAPLPVAEDLIYFLWACDEYQDMHPRARLQLSFSILLMCSLGTRPGEFVESDAWKHTNEGLLYKDVDVDGPVVGR
ncbi:hypothetical protein EJ02DRAFT_439182 [Clathrospora elynae]|uniref:Uncharacterized protein n=1 Tax=Clathrospora elynae TaxID=706981 RepID=A0A6A5SAR5_9PLEO|nr:hypothetical protein EJ02DRAFT_439182 [Clathrospora elynae]